MNNTQIFKPENKEQAKILSKLTFGFEIEGMFSADLRTKLRAVGRSSDDHNYHGGFKYDGSVHELNPRDLPAATLEVSEDDSDTCESCEGSGEFNNDCTCFEYDNVRRTCELEEHYHSESCVSDCQIEEHEHEGYACYETECYDNDEYHIEECEDCGGTGYYSSESAGDTATEYASPVFQSVDDMLMHLDEFNKKTHIFNDSCGLHLHIGTKDSADRAKLWSLVGNMKLLDRLEAQALKSCACQKERTLNQQNPQYHRTRYARKPINGFELIADFKRSEKYRFVRFHSGLGTLEFRYLAPCYHKVENVKKMLSLILEFATENENIHEVGEAETENSQSQPVFELVLPVRSTQEVENETRDMYTAEQELMSLRYSLTGRDYMQSDDDVRIHIDYEVMKTLNRDFRALRYPQLFHPKAIHAFKNWLLDRGMFWNEQPNIRGNFITGTQVSPNSARRALTMDAPTRNDWHLANSEELLPQPIQTTRGITLDRVVVADAMDNMRYQWSERVDEIMLQELTAGILREEE